MEDNEPLENKQEEKIINLIKNRQSIEQIEKETGYSTISIVMLLEKAREEGILILEEEEEPVIQPTPLEVTIKGYIEKGYTNKQIAHELGLTYSKVYYAIRHMEIKGLLMGTERKKKISLVSEQEENKRMAEERKEALEKLKEQVKTLAGEHHSRREIANKLNIEYGRVDILIQYMIKKGILKKEDIKPSARAPKGGKEKTREAKSDVASRLTTGQKEKIALCKQLIQQRSYGEALIILQSIEEGEITEEQKNNIEKMKQLLANRIRRETSQPERG